MCASEQIECCCMGAGKINLSIDSDGRQVQHIGAVVRCLCGELDLAAVKPSSVELAVVEAVNNSIIHAYQSESGNAVDVTFEYFADRLSIKIKDYGKPMPNSVAVRLSGRAVTQPIDVPKQDLPESGWGIELLKAICDQVSYQSLHSGNTTSLSFKLASATATA